MEATSALHSFVAVLLPADTADVRKAVKRLIARYDQNAYTAPIKKYMPHRDIDHYTWQYKTGGDLHRLAARLKAEYRYDDAGVDEIGVWVVTEVNIDSRWDYWTIGGNYSGLVRGNAVHDLCADDGESISEEEHLRRNVCPVIDMPENVIPFSVVTPAGEWVSQMDLGWSLLEAYGEGVYRGRTQEAEAQWPSMARAILYKHLDCIAVGLDVHS